MSSKKSKVRKMNKFYNRKRYLESLMFLPQAGINLRTVGGLGSHIGPIFVAKPPYEDKILIAPLRDEKDKGKLLVDKNKDSDVILEKTENNSTLIQLSTGQEYEVFDKYINIIKCGNSFHFVKYMERFYLRKWNSKEDELRFPEDPRN